MFALMVVPRCLLSFMVLDYQEVLAKKARFQNALDAAALVGANLQIDEEDVDEAVKAAFEANLEDKLEFDLGKLSIDVASSNGSGNSRSISVSYHDTIPYRFGEFFKNNK